MLQGFIIGIMVMSLLGFFGAMAIDSGYYLLGNILLGPACWIIQISCGAICFVIRIFSPHKVTERQFKELCECSMYYKHCKGEYHWFRVYGSKRKHPILYHIIVLRRVIIIDNERVY